MSRRKTKPEEIKNPEHYFNRYIALEVKHDAEEEAKYYEQHTSLEEMLESGKSQIGSQAILQMILNEHGELFEPEGECKTVEAWFHRINNKALHKALLTLTNRQKTIVFLRYYCEKTQKEVARMLEMTQQGVSRNEKLAIKKLKKFLLVGCEKL